MMIIDNKYNLQQEVYLITDDEQKKRIITAITARVGTVLYELSCGTQASTHYDFEMSDTENVELKIK